MKYNSLTPFILKGGVMHNPDEIEVSINTKIDAEILKAFQTKLREEVRSKKFFKIIGVISFIIFLLSFSPEVCIITLSSSAMFIYCYFSIDELVDKILLLQNKMEESGECYFK